MAKQLNIKLGVEADTSQAKREIQQLQQSLDNLMKSSAKNSSFNDFKKDVGEAQQSIIKLQTALNNSLNADTGRLDLSKFNTELDKSGLTVGQLAAQMNGLGVDGQKAFLNLANSIVTAQKPMRETNKLLDGMWTALKNTARWQISSSILHGFMGALQGAYGYAQDLNESLTNIAIVTGRSVDQMRDFATQANKAAQALSTTTVAYTDAALIYYQQGLSDEEVKARTDVTMQMANVTGESAEHVSSYMTAIWNNFAKGSDDLALFADKITALGAATASSSEEIANGMQQFAAIADTVGLSYDYAATALATVVAQTRQSESTVGNSFRTIFSRLEGLKLGETLEDGTDLNKYSKALETIGVSIKDQNGELKDMDTILDEIGSKWETLGRDTQIALAQTVGGVRQYANLIALFDHWDTFQKNLEVTRGAEGTLQEQQDIYAQGWEAAAKRVKAAWESIYQDLINDKFFITVLNSIQKILKGVDGLIHSLGGLKGVIGLIGMIGTTVFEKQLTQSIERFQQRLKVATEIAKTEADALVEVLKKQLDTYGPEKGIGGDDTSESIAIKALKDQIELNLQLRDIYDQLNDRQKVFAQQLIENTKYLGDEAQKARELVENLEVQGLSLKMDLRDQVGGKNSIIENLGASEEIKTLSRLTKGTAEYRQKLVEITDTTYAMIGSSKLSQKTLMNYIDVLAQIQSGTLTADDLTKKYNLTNGQTKAVLEALAKAQQEGKNATEQNIIVLKAINDERKKERAGIVDANGKLDENSDRYKELTKQIEETTKAIEELEQEQQGSTFTGLNPETITRAAQGITSLVTGLSSMSQFFDTMEDENLSFFEKLKQGLPSLAMGIGSLSRGLENIGPIFDSLSAAAKSAYDAAYKASKNFLDGLTAGFGAIMAQIGPILILTLAVWALKKSWDAYQATTADGRLKAANEQMEQAAQKAQEASQAYDDLANSYDNYLSLKEKINNKEDVSSKAIRDQNDELLELILNTKNWNKILKDGIQYEDNGLIHIDEAQLELLQKEWEKEASAQRRLEIEQKIAALHAEDDKTEEGYSGWRLMGGAGTLDVSGQKVSVSNMDKTSQLAEDLAEGHFTSKSDLLVYGENGRVSWNKEAYDFLTNQKGYTETELELFAEALTSKDKKVAEDIRSFLLLSQEKEKTIAKEFAYNEQYARDLLQNDDSGLFESLGTEGQNQLTNQLANLGSDQLQNFAKDLAASGDLEQTLKDYDIILGKIIPNIEVAANKLGHDLFSTANVENLTHYKGGVEEFNQELSELADYIQKNAKEIDGLSDHLIDCREAAEIVANAIIRFDDAIQDVTENYDDWMTALESDSMQAHLRVAKDLQKAYGNLLDIDGSKLSASFLEAPKNLELMKEAINDNIDAYNRLFDAARVNLLDVDYNLPTEKAEQYVADINNAWDNLESILGRKIEVEEPIDFSTLSKEAAAAQTQLENIFNDILATTASSVEEAEKLMSQMGYSAEFIEVDDPITETTKANSIGFVTEAGPDIIGAEVQGISGQLNQAVFHTQGVRAIITPAEETTTSTKTAHALKIKPGTLHKAVGGDIKFKHSSHGGGGAGKKSSGGGGSKTPKRTTQKKKEHIKNVSEKDRYHNIKEKIEDLNTEMGRLNKNEDRAYGKDRVKYMDKMADKIEDQIGLTKEYIKEIEAYAKTDKKALEQSLKEIGMSQREIANQFGPDGVLKDYEGLLDKIQKKFDATATASYNSAIDAYNRAVDAFNNGPQDDAAKESFDKAKETLDAAKETYDKQKEQYEQQLKNLKQYEDTINLWQEKNQELIDQLNDLYDKMLEIASYKVELSLDVSADDKKFLEWIYKHLGDEADRAADRVANLGKQMKTTQNEIATYSKGISDLFAMHGIDVDLNNGNLNGAQLASSLEKFIEDMRKNGSEADMQTVIEKFSEYRDGLMDSYDTLRDLSDEVTENVVNAFDEWNEKLEKNLDLMDHYDTVIDSYKAIADLLGQDQLGLTDTQLAIYEDAKLHNQQNAAAASKDAYDAIIKQRIEAEQALAQASSEEERNRWQEILDHILETEKEAEEEYLKRWEDALRQAEENFQASLERNEKAYKKSLGAGTGTLDMLQEQLEMQKELDNLYLDDYEKYKKLGDLTANINKSLANNPNIKIQNKMKDLLDDVNAKMADGAQISEGEAAILEKRLMLLQAEDQLMAARNAKSAVRMTRDNEGNFSYTYTADADKIQDAQQNYADKFYELLDYERQYADDTQAGMLQSWQDFLSKRNDILDDDMLSDAERNKALEKLKGDYADIVNYYADELAMVTGEMDRLKTDDWKDMEQFLGRLLAGPDDFQTDLSQTVLGQIANGEWTAPEELVESWTNAANTMYDADSAARQKWIESNEETNRRVDTTTAEFAANYEKNYNKVAAASDAAAESAENMAQAMGPAMEEVTDAAKAFDDQFGTYMDNVVQNIERVVDAINNMKEALAGVDPAFYEQILDSSTSPRSTSGLNPVSGATGMYTGAWGAGGKLAILHEKELVLNKDDTANLLQAVDFIRSMPTFQGANLGSGINYNSLAAVGSTGLQQQVHIDASFPNVQSHNEIELALNNLINSASQYVNRK